MTRQCLAELQYVFECRRLVIRHFNVGFAGFQKCSQGKDHFPGDFVLPFQFEKHTIDPNAIKSFFNVNIK